MHVVSFCPPPSRTVALASEPPDGTPFPFALGLCPVAHPQRRADYLASCARGTAAEDGYRRFLDRQTADGMLRAQTGYFGGSVEVNLPCTMPAA